MPRYCMDAQRLKIADTTEPVLTSAVVTLRLNISDDFFGITTPRGNQGRGCATIMSSPEDQLPQGFDTTPSSGRLIHIDLYCTASAGGKPPTVVDDVVKMFIAHTHPSSVPQPKRLCALDTTSETRGRDTWVGTREPDIGKHIVLKQTRRKARCHRPTVQLD